MRTSRASSAPSLKSIRVGIQDRIPAGKGDHGFGGLFIWFFEAGLLYVALAVMELAL